MAANHLRDRTAIVGVGFTEYSKDSKVSTLTLALRAIDAALNDAGLTRHELDGAICHRLGDSADPAQVVQALGLRDISFIRDVHGGGSSSVGVIAGAAFAVATGQADCVVCWRSLNARSEVRMGGAGGAIGGDAQYWLPYRHMTAPQLFAMHARRYMDQVGIGSEDLGRVAITQRANALLNPRALMRTPLTMDDYLASRWIVEPFRLFDCCLETDVGVAVIVTSQERAWSLRQHPILIAAATFGIGSLLVSNHFSDFSVSPAAVMAPRLYAQAGLGPKDIDVAELYDAFTSLVLMQLEAYGFCRPGEGADMVRDGSTTLTGPLPVNTHGGHLSEGYAHGLNHVVEAVQQLRGVCGDRQVPKAEVALATSQPGIFSGLTAAAILRRA